MKFSSENYPECQRSQRKELYIDNQYTITPIIIIMITMAIIVPIFIIR